ncbi:MAG: sigma factor-like helix-turn-helix DNA-binding protein [Myxococcota bacterium]
MKVGAKPVDAPEEIPGETALDDSPGRRRARTMSRKEMMRDRRRAAARGELLEVLEYDRPRTRADCVNGPRPCLFVSCRYHLYLDVNPETGSVKLNFPDKEVWDLEQTCALDVAERGGVTLEEVGEIMNLTRERIRQVEVRGLQKLKDVPESDGGIEAFEDWEPNGGNRE